MKKQVLLWITLVSIFAIGNAQITIPDANFKTALLAHTNPVIDTSGDGEISIAEAEAVTSINVSYKNIRDLSGIEHFKNLERLYAHKNELTLVDVSSNLNLITLYLYSNLLTNVDVSSNLNLTRLNLGANSLTNIDISNNIKLTNLSLHQNKLEKLNVFSNVNLAYLYLFVNPLTNIDISRNVELTSLNMVHNSLTTLDVSNNVKLTSLALSSNSLIRFDISNNIELTRLDLHSNSLTEFDVSNNINLYSLLLGKNELTNIDVTNNPLLKYLFLDGNGLTNVDLSNQTTLTNFRIGSNNLTTLDVRSCALTDVDFSRNPNLETVFMTGQPLEYRAVLGEEVLNLGLSNCPKLQFICADQGYLNDIYTLLDEAYQTSCQLSNDCDVPHNRIQGNVTFDLDNDGCGNADDVPFRGSISVSAFQSGGAFQITNAFPNDQGVYTIHLTDGNYNLLPNLANNNYFEFTNPVSIPVFDPTNPLNPFGGTPIPAGLASLTTDYCIQSLGDFDDLEISIFPISRAQAGFNATYLIRYKNIGTTVQSGTVTLDYQDDVLDYVSSTPSVDSDSNGQLTWGFEDLSPMEMVEIPLTFKLNSPMDSPALNGGEILNYTATITGTIDETPENNVMNLAQTVVNSYDPNDKTCLEGDILDPDDVGGYLHYLIRFENEGSAEARTIRVLDVIDTEKLDIETLMPLEGSHSYTTTITNENEVEFTFNNINLPFDDANNDGYVLFKIKSKDTLVEGDEIVNSAAIYFDFNFPIITENSVVKVEKEVVDAGGFSDYFTLSPNPTTGILNLTVLDDSIAVNYMLIYDIGGNLVGYYFGTTRTMDVSYLFPNTYFMQIYTDKGELTTQFIKL